MPVYGTYRSNTPSLRQLAIQQVSEKFPDLPKESSGWYRAVENRFKRLARR